MEYIPGTCTVPGIHYNITKAPVLVGSILLTVLVLIIHVCKYFLYNFLVLRFHRDATRTSTCSSSSEGLDAAVPNRADRTVACSKKIRPHLDFLSIPRLWGKKCQNVLRSALQHSSTADFCHNRLFFFRCKNCTCCFVLLLYTSLFCG